MDTRHIKDIITEALHKGNWIAFHQFSSAYNKEYYFFYSKNDAKEFVCNNRSKAAKWAVTYVASIKHFSTKELTNPQFFSQLILKHFKMNDQNVTFLKDNVKYMGFGENLHADLEQNIREGKAEFQLVSQLAFNQKPMEATLNFRKADNSDMDFFNSYTAKLERNNNRTLEQTFYINKGKGVTAKEDFNLLDGRAVFKELMNKEDRTYNAWLQLDFKNKDKYGNHIVKQYHDNYGYDLAKSLSSLSLKELQNDTQGTELIRSLEKGNIQSVAFEINGKKDKMFIEANPQYKTISIYDGQMNKVKKDALDNDHAKTLSPPKEKLQPDSGKKINGNEHAVDPSKGVKIREKKAKPTKDDSLLPKKRSGHKKGLGH